MVRASLPLVALVLANLVPLVGVAFFGWSLAEVMVLFWLESAIVGVDALARMGVTGRLLAVPLGAFFLVHYGIFMAAHLVFLVHLFVLPAEPTAAAQVPVDLGPFTWAALALAASHGVSFWRDFLHGPERERKLVGHMVRPYLRIVPMHLAILGGGFFVLEAGDVRAPLVILVVLKTLVDAGGYLVTRAGPNQAAAG